MRLYCSVNIRVPHDDSNQIYSSFNTGNANTICKDLPGESVLYGVVSGVIIKIDIVPEAIKSALEKSGVTFS